MFFPVIYTPIDGSLLPYPTDYRLRNGKPMTWNVFPVPTLVCQNTYWEWGTLVTPAEQYRALAAKLRARARTAENVGLAVEWNHLAECYIRLAEQADKNSSLDVTYEPILPRLTDRKPLTGEC